MLRSVIIEDEDHALEYLGYLIDSHTDIELVGHAADADNGNRLIRKERPDIVYLDVSLPRKDGFQLLKEIDRKKYRFHLIFTTGYEEYAIKAIKEDAHDFLLKPVDKQEFNKSVDRILNQQYHLLKNKQLVRLEDIIYIKSVGNDLEYYLTDRIVPLRERRSLKSMLDILPSNTYQHVHRSYIINRQHIKQLNANSVLMSNSKLINVSENVRLNVTSSIS